MPRGQTIAANCPFWPRLLEPTTAAAYVGFNLKPFEARPELTGLVHMYFGKPLVDIRDLDALIDAEKSRITERGKR